MVKADGSIWFTDAFNGIPTDYEGGRQRSQHSSAVYRFDTSTGVIAVVADDLDGPNVSPDESLPYVSATDDQSADKPRQYIRTSSVEGGDKLLGGAILLQIDPGYCDGLRVDDVGNVWSGAADGVHCLDKDGQLLGNILVPHRVSNLPFGGLAKNRLFIAGSESLHSLFHNLRRAQAL